MILTNRAFGCKIIGTQKNNTAHLRFCALSGALLDGVFGDKEIAVKIRGNSHYRN